MYRILGWKLFSFSISNVLPLSLLAFIVAAIENSTVNLLLVSLEFFSRVTFKTLLFSMFSSSFNVMWLCIDLILFQDDVLCIFSLENHVFNFRTLLVVSLRALILYFLLELQLAMSLCLSKHLLFLVMALFIFLCCDLPRLSLDEISIFQINNFLYNCMILGFIIHCFLY